MSDSLRIDAADARSMVDASQAIVLDVVAPMSWDALEEAVRGAIRIPPEEIPRRYAELPRERAIIAYCT